MLGVLDQTSPGFVPSYRVNASVWSSDARFVRAIEERLPSNAMVFQMPYQSFPEAGFGQPVEAYEPLRGYLHSSDLRWSYGAMRGRPADWSEETLDQPIRFVLPEVAAAGFEGLWIDRRGYPQGAEHIQRAASDVTGSRPLLSDDGQFAFFDIRRYASEFRAQHAPSEVAAVRRATLSPVHVTWMTGFGSAQGDGVSTWHWMAKTGTLVLENPDRAPREIVFEATLTTPQPAITSIAQPSGTVERVRTDRRPVRLRVPLKLPAGRTSLALTTDAAAEPGTRARQLQIIDPLFAPPVVGGVLREG